MTGRSPRLLTSCGLVVAATWTRSAALATRAASSRVSRAVILKLTSLGECGAYCGIVALRGETFASRVSSMSRIVKRSASQAVMSGPSRRGVPLPQFVPPQLSRPVEKPPSGPQWLHEIKLDGYRMAARIDNGRVQLLTRTGLDWTSKYQGVIAALANLNVKTAYIDGELCGVDDAGLPTFAQTQAATDGGRGVRLVYYGFDLLHLADWDVSKLPLIQRKALLERWLQTSQAFNSMAMTPATGNSS
jgi:ATP-dependent DNA ligase